MDIVLSPREIQTRIRAGESIDDLAQDAGMPAEKIEPFAAPVLAEREHVVGQALACPIRRKGESSSARSLRQVVREYLQHRGVDIDDVEWDSWREPDRRWTVVARHAGEEDLVEAHFTFDPRGRFSTANDDAARGLIGEPLPSATPPAEDPDSEPTVDLDEEAAELRAQQQDAQQQELPEHEPFPADEAPLADPTRRPDFATQRPEPGVSAQDAQDDLVGHESQLDVLYDMLSSFDEDSVNIYADLNVPPVEDIPEEEPAEEVPAVAAAGDDFSPEPHQPELHEFDEIPDEVPEAAASIDTEVEEAAPEPSPTPEPPAEKDPDPSPAEPEQDPLVEAPPAKPRPRSRKGRASVPSWDEIMFGGPRPKK